MAFNPMTVKHCHLPEISRLLEDKCSGIEKPTKLSTVTSK
jgi:hypothetical protein